jgi:hypothetical protein
LKKTLSKKQKMLFIAVIAVIAFFCNLQSITAQDCNTTYLIQGLGTTCAQAAINKHVNDTRKEIKSDFAIQFPSLGAPISGLTKTKYDRYYCQLVPELYSTLAKCPILSEPACVNLSLALCETNFDARLAYTKNCTNIGSCAGIASYTAPVSDSSNVVLVVGAGILTALTAAMTF